MSSSLNDFNQKIIAEFRANEGKIGGQFANTPLLLLHTIGAKSGQTRINPLAYLDDDDKIIVIASKAGSPNNPDWLHNIVANPMVTVELGSERFLARATAITSGPERDRLYAKMAERNPGFAEYERNTTRTIPVVVLERTE